MPNFASYMIEAVGSLESKAFNIAKNTEEDFVKNVKQEFGFGMNQHQKHNNGFTHKHTNGRSINHRYKTTKKIM